jgi:hypothetical protein
MDGLDLLLNGFKKETSAKSVKSVKNGQISSHNDLPSPSPTSSSTSSSLITSINDTAKVKQIEAKLKLFINDLADQEIRGRINFKLRKIKVRVRVGVRVRVRVRVRVGVRVRVRVRARVRVRVRVSFRVRVRVKVRDVSKDMIRFMIEDKKV